MRNFFNNNLIVITNLQSRDLLYRALSLLFFQESYEICRQFIIDNYPVYLNNSVLVINAVRIYLKQHICVFPNDHGSLLKTLKIN